MNGIVDRLLAAQRELAERPVGEILAALAVVTERWLDWEDPIRREAQECLVASTGMAPAMIHRGLDEMIARVRGIPDLLDADLGSRAVLDGFVRRGDGSVASRAFGPGLLVCLFSGNVPGLPAFDMALGLALKSACLIRPAAVEPHFADLFARSVAEVDPLLGRCLAVERWEHGARWPYQSAGAVLAYGSDQSVGAIAAQVPSAVRFLGHGHKIGLAMIGREAATEKTATLLALDVAMYEQQGCVSPHMAFVERGGPLTPRTFSRACGKALEALEAKMPRCRLALPEAAALRAARDEAEITADTCFSSVGNLAWTVVHCEQPAYRPSPLNRLLRTFAVDRLADAVALVAPYAAYLQTVSVAADEARRLALAGELGHLGASRISPVGRAQQPSPLWRHDGRPTAGDLVRWADLEEQICTDG